MITRTEQEIRHLRQQLANAPVPSDPPPILKWLIDNVRPDRGPGTERPIHPDAEQMLTEWNQWIETQHG